MKWRCMERDELREDWAGDKDLNDGVEEADPKDDLPPVAAQDVLLKEAGRDLSEGPTHVGPQAFGRLIRYLE